MPPPHDTDLHPPLPPHALTDTSVASHTCKASLVVSEFGIHNHSFSCAKKPRGSEGCRFFRPAATIDETTAVLVTKGAAVSAVSIEHVLAERTLPPTVPEGTAIVWELRRPRFELPDDTIASTSGLESMPSAAI